MSRSLLHYLLLSLTLLLAAQTSATHNRAGEITYRHVEGFTWEVTVLTCTDVTNINNADRPFLPIDWGHGNSPDSIARTFEDVVMAGVKRNEYTTLHTFPGPGVYELYVEDPNRNGGIINIPSSIDVIFSITSVLVIPSSDPVGGFNNSPQLFNPPKGDACLNVPWLHNPAAFDPDGDSLSYELLACTGANGMPITDYVFPNEASSNEESLTIDPLTGTVLWENPTMQGEFNLCIRINEFRNGVFNGSVVRDMQIVVSFCINQPPVIDPLPDLCVLAGSAVSQQITASDPDGDLISISLSGEPFLIDGNPATFSQSSYSGTAEGTFQWGVNCDQVRSDPYGVAVTVRDSSASPGSFTSLTDYDEFEVLVISPPVENFVAEALQGQMILDWDNGFCDNATGYKVYRRIESSDFQPGECETGLPESEGYELIATVEGWENSEYVDTNVPFGFDVCYRIVTCFADGAESIVSDESCASILREIPILTHTSVGVTDVSIGVDTVRWLPPNQLDTLEEFTGQFFYRLYRTLGLVGERILVETTDPSPILDVIGGFEYIDTGLDTETNIHTYDVEIYHLQNGEEELISTSNPSRSIFLTIEPLDQSLLLSWTDLQPWDNYLFEVYILEEGSGEFIYLDETEDTEYLHDTLLNGQEYCYLIKAFGEYDPLTGISGPFINFSQEECAVPIDLTPPCPPALEVNGNCEEGTYSLSWSDPNDFCADDVTEYNLYYSPTDDGPLEFLVTIVGSTDTSYVPLEDFPIGCYAVTALDTRTEPDGTAVMNESILSDTVCIEGCPVYTLPNVITPNGDESNEFFRPFEPWAYVERVDFKVFNRWGNLIFETEDPELMWRGKSMQTDERVSDGVYFYHIDIFEITLQGLIPRSENGTIHVFRNRSDFKQ